MKKLNVSFSFQIHRSRDLSVFVYQFFNLKVSLRKSSKYKSTKCGNYPTECQESLGIFSQKQCSYCYLKFCSNCISNTPAKVLYDSHLFIYSLQIIEFMWEKPQVVCKKCF